MIGTVLELKDVRKYFPVTKKMVFAKDTYIKAVDGISLEIEIGKTLGLIGESGSGKSTVGRLAARLYEPTKGAILYEGKNVTDFKGKALRKYRTNIQMVFQDPYNSLNPRLTVEEIISEPLRINHWGTRTDVNKRTKMLMDAVGLASNMTERKPHEFSGGQRQRIAICRALALNPKIIVCDAPVSALDVSIQARIINLFADLQKEFNLSYLFISHDLNVVRLIADEIAVMYLGVFCETGPADLVLSKPLHPYSEALLASVPDPHNRKGFFVLPGEIPSNIHPPSGCRFHTRCPYKMDICESKVPLLAETEEKGYAACFRYSQCGSTE